MADTAISFLWPDLAGSRSFVDGEATLKRFYREADGSVRLQPANAAMEPVMVRPPQQLDIRGVVRGVLRKF